MITRHTRFEYINGKAEKLPSELVTFVSLTGTQQAIIIDKQGKRRRVMRKTLLDVPNAILWPDIPIVGTVKFTSENWKRACYYD